jgi:hypothetical protein
VKTNPRSQFQGHNRRWSAVGLSCAPFVARWSLASPTAPVCHGVEPRVASHHRGTLGRCSPSWRRSSPGPGLARGHPRFVRPPVGERPPLGTGHLPSPSPLIAVLRRGLVPCRAGTGAVGLGLRSYLPSPFADSGAAAGIPPRLPFRPPLAEPRLRRVHSYVFGVIGASASQLPKRVTCTPLLL